ncbi:MAG: hypothetical protein Q9164_006246 [Protoblastenia rupestris]
MCDIREEPGKAYQQELKEQGLEVNFTQADVTDWASLTAAFKSTITYSHTQSLDIVVAVAGLFGAPFILPYEEPASLDNDPTEPPTTGPVIDVNIKGVYYTCKLAQHYFGLKGTHNASPTPRKSLIVMGSLAGYFEFPQVVDYPLSKWAVRGLFRAIRPVMEDQGYRMNLIAPWIMDTPMSADFVALFRSQDIPVGNPQDVVDAAVRCATDDSIVGRSLGVGVKETFDLCDDAEGGYSTAIIKEYLDTEAKKFIEFFHLR